MYTFDTETSYSVILNEAWVWSWALCDENLNVTMGDGTDMLREVTRLPDKSEIWVHNLSYDGEFILWDAIKAGFKIAYDLNPRDKHHGVIELRQDLSGILSLTLWTKGRRVTFRDSLRIFRCKLAELPKTCGFEDIDHKEDAIDYEAIRPRNHKKTPEEASYQAHDVTVLMRAMQWIRSFAAKGNTVGAIAMNEFKKSLAKKSPFTPLTQEEREILKSLYSGGVVHCPPATAGRWLHGLKGRVYDRNSMYPAECDKPLPVAVKAWHIGLPRIIWSGCWAVHVIARGLRLREGCFPTLITPFTGAARSYIPVIDKWIFCDEWARVRQSYDIEAYDEVESVEFETEEFAREFVDKWYAIKQLNDGRRTFSKYVLNNLTGKWGENSQHEEVRRVATPNAIVGYRHNEYSGENNWAFMPAVARVTSTSRMALADAAAAGGIDHLMYTDTDSVHFDDADLPDHMVDGHRLGAWKREAVFDSALYIKPKTYAETLGGVTAACRHAGINDTATVCDTTDPRCFDERDATGALIHDTGIPISPHNMMPGSVYYTNQHKRVKGGVALVRVAKRM